MGVESGRGRWCSGADEVVVVVGRCVCKCEAGEGAEGQKYKIKPLGSIWAHCQKWRWRAVRGGGTMVRMRWW